MKRLFVSTIPDDFNPDVDLALGPFCFLNKEAYSGNWDNINFPDDPFDTENSLKNASDLTCNYANKALPDIASYLNDTNNTNHSLEFWRFLIFPWLIGIIQSIYEREQRILSIIDELKKDEVEIYLQDFEDFKWEFENTFDFFYNGLLNPAYNEWVISEILKKTTPDTWKVSIKKNPEAKNKKLDESNFRKLHSSKNINDVLKKYFKTIKRKVYDNFLIRLRCVSPAGFNGFDILAFSFLLSIKKAIDVNIVVEKHKNYVEFNERFSKLIYKSIPLCYENLKNIKIKLPTFRKGKIRIANSALYYDEKLKYLLASGLESGEHVFLVQHGGGGGILKSYPLQSEIDYKQLRYITWGWREHEDYDIRPVPLPSPYLAKFNHRHQNLSDELLFVSTAAHLYSQRLHSVPQAKQQLFYRKSKLDFISNLKSDLFDKVLYRPYFNEFGALKDESFLKEHFPKLKIFAGNLHDKLATTKLVIIDHIGTTHNITYVMNTPTIIFWNPAHWHVSRQFQPVLELLENANLYFDNGAAAANFINKIWDDIDSWWNDQKTINAKKIFCEHFALADSNWRIKWLRRIWELT